MGAFNGSGTFLRSYSWQTDAANGIKIRADRMDTEDDGFAAGLTDCITRDGQSPATANLPMGGHNHTGVTDGTARDQYASIGQMQDGAALFAVATYSLVTGVDTYAAAPLPALQAYTDGGEYRIRFPTGNTAINPTLNLNALGAKTIVGAAGWPLAPGSIQDGAELTVRYVSAFNQMRIVNDGLSHSALLLSGSVSATNIIEFKSILSSLYRDYEIRIRKLITIGGTSSILTFLVSTNNGTSYYTTGYKSTLIGGSGLTLPNSSGIPLTGVIGTADIRGVIDIKIFNPSVANNAIGTPIRVTGAASVADTSPTAYLLYGGTSAANGAGATNACAIAASNGGAFSCDYEVWGYP